MIYWVKAEELWGRVCVRITSFFSFPHAYTRLFCPTNYKNITKHFQCGYKTKTKLKHRTHYAIFQNRRICADRPAIWFGVLCGLCILPYMHGLRSALVSEYSLLGCFMRYWLVWALSVRERECVWRFCVFVIVDVKYIIHYRRMCKFICSL